MSISIYYLDDEEALCDIFVELFETSSVRVTTFVDADLAIEACQLTPPDLIFIDFRLSNTTGDEVASILAESIPKILVTGDFSFKLKSDFVKVTSKPFDLDEIEELIARYL